MKVNDIMSKDVVSIAPDDMVSDAARLMKDYDIGAVAVVSKGEIRGIITDRDITIRCTAAMEDPATVKAENIMSPHITSVHSSDTVDNAIGKMGKHQVQRLAVIDNGKLQGILSLSDIARQRVYTEISEAVAEIKE